MQRVIEEILKTEEGCARRLEEARAAVENRRAEIEAETAERIRDFQERAEAQAANSIRTNQEKLRAQSQAAIERARDSSERELAANQLLLDRIVNRIVDLVTGTTHEE